MNYNTNDWVEWIEPFFISETAYMRVSIKTAIAYQHERLRINSNGKKQYKSDEEALQDFLFINWAVIVPSDSQHNLENLSPEALASVKRGLQQSAEGKTRSLGSFAKLASEE
jgi:hypothetical protein